MDIIAATAARNQFLDLVDQVDKFFKRFIITKKGEPKAVIMSAEEFKSWEETLYTLSNAKSRKAIREGESDWKKGQKGNFISLKEIKKKLKT